MNLSQNQISAKPKLTHQTTFLNFVKTLRHRCTKQIHQSPQIHLKIQSRPKIKSKSFHSSLSRNRQVPSKTKTIVPISQASILSHLQPKKPKFIELRENADKKQFLNLDEISFLSKLKNPPPKSRLRTARKIMSLAKKMTKGRAGKRRGRHR
jgi:hypothetical protein